MFRNVPLRAFEVIQAEIKKYHFSFYNYENYSDKTLLHSEVLDDCKQYQHNVLWKNSDFVSSEQSSVNLHQTLLSYCNTNYNVKTVK